MASQSAYLTDTHLQTILNGLKTLDGLQKEIILAKQAGIDVSQQEQQMNDARAKLLALKNTYFPNT